MQKVDVISYSSTVSRLHGGCNTFCYRMPFLPFLEPSLWFAKLSWHVAAGPVVMQYHTSVSPYNSLECISAYSWTKRPKLLLRELIMGYPGTFQIGFFMIACFEVFWITECIFQTELCSTFLSPVLQVIMPYWFACIACIGCFLFLCI